MYNTVAALNANTFMTVWYLKYYWYNCVKENDMAGHVEF